MTHNALVITRSLQRSPFLMEVTTTPHIPPGITERLPVNVTFVVNIKRRDPNHLMFSGHQYQEIVTHLQTRTRLSSPVQHGVLPLFLTLPWSVSDLQDYMNITQLRDEPETTPFILTLLRRARRPHLLRN